MRTRAPFRDSRREGRRWPAFYQSELTRLARLKTFRPAPVVSSKGVEVANMRRADAPLRPYVRSLHAAGLAFFVVDAGASALPVAGTVVARELCQKLLCSLAAGFCCWTDFSGRPTSESRSPAPPQWRAA